MTQSFRSALASLMFLSATALSTPASAANLSTHVLDLAQGIGGRGVPGMLGFAGRTV